MTTTKTYRSSNHNPQHHHDAVIWVATTPPIQDPREMQTILTTSLRALWGNLEGYSSTLSVRTPESSGAVLLKTSQSIATTDAKRNGLLCVSCPAQDTAFIQAALTMITAPPYLEDTLYCFDVIDIQYMDTWKKDLDDVCMHACMCMRGMPSSYNGN